MWTPLPVAEPSYSVAKWCAGGYVKQVPGDRRWKKNARNPESAARLAG